MAVGGCASLVVLLLLMVGAAAPEAAAPRAAAEKTNVCSLMQKKSWVGSLSWQELPPSTPSSQDTASHGGRQQVQQSASTLQQRTPPKAPAAEMEVQHRASKQQQKTPLNAPAAETKAEALDYGHGRAPWALQWPRIPAKTKAQVSSRLEGLPPPQAGSTFPITALVEAFTVSSGEPEPKAPEQPKFLEEPSGFIILEAPVENGPIRFSAVAVEYAATALLVTAGCGCTCAVSSRDKEQKTWVLQVALTWGIAIACLGTALVKYHGGQMNCAVTFGLVLAGECTVAQGVANFFAQMLGSISGAAVLLGMFTAEADKTTTLGSNELKGVSGCSALLGEAFVTCLLMLVVLQTAGQPLGPLAVGLTVFLAHAVLIPVDGCSINPTRSFGPALVARWCRGSKGTFESMWVFWVGPLCGAAVAVCMPAALHTARTTIAAPSSMV